MSEMWCRSCGAGVADEVLQVCSTCGVSLEAPTMAESHIGLAYEVPGKLRVTKRLGICTNVDGDSAQLHISPKDKDNITVPVSSLGSPSDVVPATLSPAARLIYPSRQPEGSIKAHWDTTVLLTRASEVAASSVGTMRMVADEAMTLGWPDIVAWTTVSDAEKAWRWAHRAASSGDLEELLVHLGALPADGYERRVDLVLPYLPTVAASLTSWGPLVDSWCAAGLPGADVLHRLLQSDWDSTLLAGAERLAVTAADRTTGWSAARAELEAGEPKAPLAADSPSWAAAAIVFNGRAGQNIDDSYGEVSWLASSLLDDLIDAGSLTDRSSVASSPAENRAYLLARLRPQDLDDDAAASVGHHAELARRYCRRRDQTRLDSLPASPGVDHYRALLGVVDGGTPDPARLRPESLELLELASRSLAALDAKATSSLPAPIINDPTLWPMFAAHARSGQLAPDPEARQASPVLGQWCDLQRLVGLLWDERWLDAVSLGEKLSVELIEERYQDEALSLTAFALDQLGRVDEALDLLERAMNDSYTEALLVNLSIVASRAKPTVAASHFARLVNEAPTPELQVAALRRAVEVWNTADESPDFPPALVNPLHVVLSGNCSFEDYVAFTSVAANVAPDVLMTLPDPGGERAPVYRIQRARARLIKEPSFDSADLAKEFIAVHKQVGRPDWFNSEWSRLVSMIRESVFVPFGEAVGSAVFIDTVLVQAPDLFSQNDRFVLAPQAGAHFAASFANTDDILNAAALLKFFFRPIEEFLAERSKLDSSTNDFVADNFARAMFIAGMHYMGTTRDVQANPYNELVQRLQWDSQNRYAILGRMRALLDEGSSSQEEVERALDRLRRLAIDTEDGRERVRVMSEALAEWRSETVRLRANL